MSAWTQKSQAVSAVTVRGLQPSERQQAAKGAEAGQPLHPLYNRPPRRAHLRPNAKIHVFTTCQNFFDHWGTFCSLLLYAPYISAQSQSTAPKFKQKYELQYQNKSQRSQNEKKLNLIRSPACLVRLSWKAFLGGLPERVSREAFLEGIPGGPSRGPSLRSLRGLRRRRRRPRLWSAWG